MAKKVVRTGMITNLMSVNLRRQILELDLERLRQSGAKSAPMQAVRLCFEQGLPPPEWAQQAIVVGDYEDVRPKRENARRRRKDCCAIWWRVHELRKASPQPPDVFGKVADEFGTSGATVKRCFDELTAEFKKALGAPEKWDLVLQENQFKRPPVQKKAKS